MTSTEITLRTPTGVRLAATWQSTAQPTAAAAPAVVLCQGLSGTRSLVLPQVAARLAEAGVGSLRFDYAGFGHSSGERGWIDPRARSDDALLALAWLRQADGVAPHRVGLYGHSFGGPVAIHTAARDLHVPAVVAVSGPGDGREMLRAARPEWDWLAFLDRVEAERASVAAGSAPTVVPVSDILPFSPEFERRYTELKASTGGTSAGASGSGLGVDHFYLASADAILDFMPVASATRLTRTNLLMINGAADDTASIDTVDAVYAAAPGVKRWIVLPSADHNALDVDPLLSHAATLAADWFVEHL